MLALTGLAARLNPDSVDDIIARLPRNPNVDLTLRTLLSADYAAFVTGVPDVRALHATNEAVLGLIMDDNSMPFGFIQASVGFPGVPCGLRLFRSRRRHSSRPPTRVRCTCGTTTTLSCRTRSPTRGAKSPRCAACSQPVRAAAGLHRVVFPQPSALRHGRARRPRHRRTSAASRRDRTPSRFHRTRRRRTRLGPRTPSRRRIPHAAGYNRLDVVTAAVQQNDGSREQVSASLAEFAMR